MKTIGDRIRIRREELNMSQDELARKLGYQSRSSINKIESDERNLPQSKIKAIADALGVNPGYIMGWADDVSDSWSTQFRKSLEIVLQNKDSSDAYDAGVNIEKMHYIVSDSSPLSLETCCNICDELGESLDEMVGLRDCSGDKIQKPFGSISVNSQKISAAYEKATEKERKMVEYILSDYLMYKEIKQVRIAALSNDGSAIDFSGADPDAEMTGDFTEGPAIP